MARIGVILVLVLIVCTSAAPPVVNNFRKGLLFYAPLNESAGTLIIDNTGFNNGTLTNTALSSTSGWNLNKNVVLDGTNDYIVMNKSNISRLSATSYLTVSCWVKLNSTTFTAAGMGIVSKWTSGNGFILLRSLNALGFYIYIGGLAYQGIFSKTADLNWHHYVGVYNNANVYAYIDGNIGGTVGTITGNVSYNSSNTLKIGTYQINNDFLNGSIKNVMIWDRALTPTEIKQLYINQSKL